uniref:Uncharacterized protein n=1 Tax=Ananas comosus var. bracteatus TaxID=296719 RepID=A0A6V7P1R4_ANACO|nr:unnamed protein product [Ananas comosus var. bracteatus]
MKIATRNIRGLGNSGLDRKTEQRVDDKLMTKFNDLHCRVAAHRHSIERRKIHARKLTREASMARVDRFLITLEWLSQFPNTMQLENMNIISDHIPIELDTGACDFKKSSVYIWKKKYDLKMKKYIILFETNRVKIMEKGHLVKPW